MRQRNGLSVTRCKRRITEAQMAHPLRFSYCSLAAIHPIENPSNTPKYDACTPNPRDNSLKPPVPPNLEWKERYMRWRMVSSFARNIRVGLQNRFLREPAFLIRSCKSARFFIPLCFVFFTYTLNTSLGKHLLASFPFFSVFLVSLGLAFPFPLYQGIRGTTS